MDRSTKTVSCHGAAFFHGVRKIFDILRMSEKVWVVLRNGWSSFAATAVTVRGLLINICSVKL